MKRLGVCVVAFFLVLFLGGSLLWNFSKNFKMHVKSNVTVPVDAVVVLTGGRGRLAAAIQLFSETKSKLLLISGVRSRITLEDIYSSDQLSGINKDQIILERDSNSTHTNALYARDELIQYPVKRIVLVTSDYHMKRALLIFQHVFPDNIDILPVAIASGHFKEGDWWTSPTSLKLLCEEYLKFWWYKAFL